MLTIVILAVNRFCAIGVPQMVNKITLVVKSTSMSYFAVSNLVFGEASDVDDCWHVGFGHSEHFGGSFCYIFSNLSFIC